MNCKTLFRRIARSAIGAGILCGAAPAFAQGCALCYTQAASASSRFIHALRGGILVLVFPPLLISVGLATAAYRKRDRFRGSELKTEQGADSRADEIHEAK
ncbi:MAG TPA: hypothetical protein VGG46_06980 [Terriglobales bacterium]|jgi:hypothetical protein